VSNGVAHLQFSLLMTMQKIIARVWWK